MYQEAVPDLSWALKTCGLLARVGYPNLRPEGRWNLSFIRHILWYPMKGWYDGTPGSDNSWWSSNASYGARQKQRDMMKRAEGEDALRRSMEITWQREGAWVLVRTSLFTSVSQEHGHSPCSRVWIQEEPVILGDEVGAAQIKCEDQSVVLAVVTTEWGMRGQWNEEK